MFHNPKKFFNFLKSNKIFQRNKIQRNFLAKNFPERAVANYLAFVEATNKLMVGDEMYEKAKEDNRKKYSDYPSA